MSRTLLALEFGPVADFIAAARKTRELWFGSWLFSEVAKAAARKLAELCGGHQALIFPAPQSPEDLAEKSGYTVTDEILAVVPETLPRVQEVAAAAKQAAHDCWVKFAELARDEARKGDIRVDMWEAQVSNTIPPNTAGEMVECYAAWVPLDGDYKSARERLKQLLAGRTNCRNFPSSPMNGRTIPKSSLDGKRETVLTKKNRGDKRDERLRLARGEQLDAPGLTKRLFGGRRNYPSTARLAADPWLRGAGKTQPRLFADFCAECEKLTQAKILAKILVSDPGNGNPFYPQYQLFPYEGAVTYLTRHSELVEETGKDESELQGLRTALTKLTKELGKPEPYYAVLAADGDGVGKALANVDSPDEHRNFSQALSGFAAAARETIDKDHQGAAVFVGGDDILAFLPLDTAIECADALRQKFSGVWPGLTLSAGIAVWHFLDSLEDALAAARAALELAKEKEGQEPRNALAVHYQPRGGTAITVRGRWDQGIAKKFARWASLLGKDLLPDKVAYELRNLGRAYKDWPAGPERRKALQADAARLMSRKKADARKEVEPLLDNIDQPELLELAETILIARRIASARAQSSEENG
jgi:CRISPR-associated protein Cmr2